LWISGTVFIGGTIGIISSGLILDKVGSSISNAFSMSLVADVLGGTVMIPMFLFINNFVVFLGVFCICFYCVFVQMVSSFGMDFGGKECGLDSSERHCSVDGASGFETIGVERKS